MKRIGQTWTQESKIANLCGHQFGQDGMIEVHDTQNHLVRVYQDDAGCIQDVRVADLGIHPQLTEAQIASIKTCLAAHDPTKKPADGQGFVLALKVAIPDTMRRNKILNAYPELLTAIQVEDWQTVGVLMADAAQAVPTSGLTPNLSLAEKSAINCAITSCAIPIPQLV